MTNSSAQTVQDVQESGVPASSSAPKKTKPHLPPAHNNQHYNVRIRQNQGAGGRTTSPSIRQSWFFPAHRASPSTAMAETTSVMTLNQRPRNIRSDASSAAPASSAMPSSVPPSTAMNYKERKNFSGSARSRLSKIKMMNNPNTTVLSPIEGPSAPSRRTRLSLQPQANPLTEPSASMETPVTALDMASRPEVLPATAVSITSSATVNSPQHQQFMASHTSSSTPTYPRHIIMRSTSPHRTIEDHLDNDPTTDSFSSSLPSTSAFAAGIDHSQLDGPISTSSSERANRHASMPLPKPGWRLHDLPDVEESDTYYDHGEGSGFGPNGNGEENSFQYSASNASSTIGFENHPYHSYAHAHTRQDSSSTFYTMTPSASNLDLSMASSHTNLSSLDPSAAPPADGNPIVSPGAQHPYQGPSHNPSSLSLSSPIHKVVKNSAKSPLALRRSSTMSLSTSSSPSNTFLSKGSFPKSSLSAIASYPTKILTLERQKIILEILRTERSYVDGLVILQTLFYEPLNAPYASGNNLGMGTTTSMYSNHHNSQLLQHHQHQPVNNDNNKQTNANTGGSAGSTMHSTMPTSPSYYASSTIGSNSTLSASAAPLLSKKSVPEIFSTFVGILKINTLLLTQLETRICGSTFSTGWESDEDEIQEEDNHPKEGDEEDQQSSSQGQQANQAPKQVLVTVGSQGGETEQLLVLDADWCVGDIFSEIAPFLKMYSSYVKSYTSALAHINECISRNDRFAEFLKTTARRPECKNLDFQAYLMLPVQRIPRYRMLLGNLLQHTPVDHPDHRKLQTAFESMEQTATIVNENIRQHEMFGEMVDLQSKINGLSEPLVAPGRSLLKHGSVWKICRRNVQLRVIILLSDCILWMSPSINPLDDTLTFHRKVGLENCTVIGAEDPDPTKNAFQIISPEKSSQVYVDTPKEKEAWMVAIRRATQEYLSAKRTLKISITPMQSISAAATSFGAGLLRRETGLWSPTTFGGESRANLFAAHVAMDVDMASGPGTTRTSLDGGYHFTPAANTAMTSGASAGGLAQRHQPQPLRVVENYNAPVWVPDQSATRCMICSEEFGTIFRRKHHCRACGKVVCHSCSTRTILIKGTHSEKVGRACDDCIDTMFPEDTNMVPPTDFDVGTSTEVSPVDAQQIVSGPDVDRRASNNSMDGIMIRPEDYSQESTGQPATGATGMVRGLVEAGLNRMKSRSGPGFIQDTNKSTSNGPAGDINPRENVRASNRKSDSHSLSNAATEHQNATQVKECGLCKVEFSMFKWRNICSQCRRVVCSDCLTKKQIDQLFLMGLEAEREAKARGDAENVDANLDMVSSPDTLSPIDALNQQDQTRPGLQQSVSDSAIVASGTDVDSMAPLEGQRSLSNDQDNGPSGGGYSGGFGGGWHSIKSNTDSGHGHAEKLCDPCYLGLSADQIKVLESGGGWQYYQATMSKHQIQNIVAALALDQLDLGDKDREDNGTQGSGGINLTPESTGAEATLVRAG